MLNTKLIDNLENCLSLKTTFGLPTGWKIGTV